MSAIAKAALNAIDSPRTVACVGVMLSMGSPAAGAGEVVVTESSHGRAPAFSVRGV